MHSRIPKTPQPSKRSALEIYSDPRYCKNSKNCGPDRLNKRSRNSVHRACNIFHQSKVSPSKSFRTLIQDNDPTDLGLGSFGKVSTHGITAIKTSHNPLQSLTISPDIISVTNQLSTFATIHHDLCTPHLLFMRKAGTHELYDALNYAYSYRLKTPLDGTTASSTNPSNLTVRTDLINLYKAFSTMVHDVANLNKNHLYHSDIKPENIMINLSTQSQRFDLSQLTLIDLDSISRFGDTSVRLFTLNYSHPYFVQSKPSSSYIDSFLLQEKFDLYALSLTELVVTAAYIRLLIHLLPCHNYTSVSDRCNTIIFKINDNVETLNNSYKKYNLCKDVDYIYQSIKDDNYFPDETKLLLNNLKTHILVTDPHRIPTTSQYASCRHPQPMQVAP